MLKKTLYTLILTGFAFLLASCAVDDTVDAGTGVTEGDELPVEFTFALPDESTRAIENPKTAFADGDMIHIQGTFVIPADTDADADTEVIRYGAMSYNERTGSWAAVAGSTLTWPNTAVSGEFVAYFVSGSTGVLYHTGDPTTDRTDTYLLSSITPDGTGVNGSYSDPLKAKSEGSVGYGHAVSLKFEHICAYLTLIELEPMVADEYWFTVDIDGDQELNNAFYLSLNENDELEFVFCAEKVTEEGPDYGRVYIAAKANSEVQTDKTITKANYFLEPGAYYTFSVRYPAGSTSNEYLKYDYHKIPEDVTGQPNVPPVLEGGRTYTLNITKSPGINIVIPPDAEGWDEQPPYHKVDVEAFLRAIASGESYDYVDEDGNEFHILEKIANGTRLLCNVDFQFMKYTRFEGPDGFFDPVVNLGQVFDGGLHYIINLGSPLFYENNGVIRNLGLKNINGTFISDMNDDDPMHDRNRQGSLCLRNRDDGVIENIRIADGADITVLVKTDQDQETHNIGCVVGSNTGHISGVEMSGDFTLTVEAYVDDDITDKVDATVAIGGLAGQNAGTGLISDVTADGSLKIAIYNKCQGEQGAFYVGGIAGLNNGYLDGLILPEVIVDGSESSGVASYMGGIAGEISTDSGTSSVTACIVGGQVIAGEVNPYGVITSASCAGGIAGALMNTPVMDCRAAVSVFGTTPRVDKVTYATGGAFGRIRLSTPVENIIVYGTYLEGTTKDDGDNCYIGNFAGIVPLGETWEETYSTKNIIVRRFTGYDDIGVGLPQ